jgi:predicted ATP-grasp superfamily ATP-dependent carboligase
MDNGHPLVVFAVGYSVRALVEACWYGGVECVAVDHFGDSDTRSFANSQWIELQLTETGHLTNTTRSETCAVATKFMQAGKSVVFLLAGGMENLGFAVEQLREIAPVFGPTEEQRQALRDLDFLYDAARDAGILTPRTRREKTIDGNWLWKPRMGAGGLKVVRSQFAVSNLESGYWQEFIAGTQIGVSCLISQQQIAVLGATRGMDATEWAGPSEFIYRGAIGPIELNLALKSEIKQLCNLILQRTGFCGWLQFDFIRDIVGKLWLLECNPRWTAGMEVLLFSGKVNPVLEVIKLHNNFGTMPLRRVIPEFECFAKAVVYATKGITVTDHMLAELNQLAGVADRPHTPQTIQGGHPIVTVRAGSNRDHRSLNCEVDQACLLEVLRQGAERVNALFLDQ